MAEHKKWLPLESNPEVLNAFASKLGLNVDKHSFCDVFGLDDDLLAMVPQLVAAVLMCYPITGDSEASAKKEDEEIASAGTAAGSQQPSPPYFMKQTIGNACGTIAVLHSLGNCLGSMQPATGSFFEQFFSATAQMSPEERGKYLEHPPEGSPSIEEAHQAAAIVGDTAPPSEDDEVNLHFVAFVVKEGHLWQLDGRRRAPVDHGPSSSESILRDCAVVVKQFIERSNSISFNLIALTATQDG